MILRFDDDENSAVKKKSWLEIARLADGSRAAVVNKNEKGKVVSRDD